MLHNPVKSHFVLCRLWPQHCSDVVQPSVWSGIPWVVSQEHLRAFSVSSIQHLHLLPWLGFLGSHHALLVRLQELLAQFHTFWKPSVLHFPAISAGSPLCKSPLWIYQSVSIECSPLRSSKLELVTLINIEEILVTDSQVCVFPFGMSLAQTLM